MPSKCSRCSGSGSESVRFWDDREGCYSVESIDCGTCWGAGVEYWDEESDHDALARAREDADAAAWDAFESWGQ